MTAGAQVHRFTRVKFNSHHRNMDFSGYAHARMFRFLLFLCNRDKIF